MEYLLGVNWESIWNVLKWVLAALIAGFIGQFGRSYALHIMEKRRRRRAEGAESGDSSRDAVPIEVQMERERLAAEAKIAKKRAKAEVKRQKKARDEAEETGSEKPERP